MSCSTGGGHNSCANALEEMFEQKSIEYERLDPLSLASERIKRLAGSTYIHITTKAPNAFGYMYKLGGAISNRYVKSPVYLANSLYSDRLYNYIVENKFDAIVMTHLFPAEAVTRIRKSKNLTTLAFFVMTDYTCIPFIEETNMDCYIAPCSDLVNECAQRGVPLKKIAPLGIPVSSDFCSKIDKKEARRELGLEEDKITFLVMSGSMGFGHVEKLAMQKLDIYGQQINLVILCGNNNELYQSLKTTFQHEPTIIPKEFTDKVSVYMRASDVVFSKPGGLTSTEAAVSNVPLIHTQPIPGCEMKNAEFFSSRGMSFYSEDITEQLIYAYRLTKNEDLKEKMLEAQRRYINANAAADISNIIAGLCK